MSLFVSAGITGMILFVLNYGLYVKGAAINPLVHDTVNATAAVLMTLYSYSIGSYPSIILQSFWGLLCIYSIVQQIDQLPE